MLARGRRTREQGESSQNHGACERLLLSVLESAFHSVFQHDCLDVDQVPMMKRH